MPATVSLYDRSSFNKTISLLLVIAFIVFIMLLGWVLSIALGVGTFGTTAVVSLAFLVAVIWALISYYKSDSITLAISRAKPAGEKQFLQLHNIVEGLAIAAGIPKPRVFIIEDSAPNAFATGRSPQHAVVCVTTGLLQKLNKLELEGVIAHELSHIKNFDIRLMTLVVVLVGIVVLISDIILRVFLWGGTHGSKGDSGSKGGSITIILIAVGLLLAILAPLIATLIKLAISRKREFLADSDGALLSRYPEGLASALEKIASDKEPLEAANKATAHLYIINPLKGKTSFLSNLFNTHPPLTARIAALRNLDVKQVEQQLYAGKRK